MANKYISHGNTYDGDGTASSAAASAGGVGAWNDLHAIWTAVPTYGSIANGDVIFIRTSISSVDISITISATWAMLARGTADLPITWVADDGTHWAGETGTLKITSTEYNRLFYFADYNNLIGKELNWEFYINPSTNTDMGIAIRFQVQNVSGIKIYTRTNTTNNQICFYMNANYLRFVNCHFGIHQSEGSKYPFNQDDGGTLMFVGCEFDVTGARSDLVLVYANTYHGGATYFYGGKVTGSVTGQNLVRHYSSSAATRVTMIGFDPGNMAFYYTLAKSGRSIGKINASLIPSEKYGFRFEEGFGQADWKEGQSYPYIASTLPDGTNWAIRILPHDTNTFRPYVSPNISQYQTGAAAVKTITVELLVCNDFGTIKKDQWYIDVSYIHDGEGRLETTKEFLPTASASNVTTSTAPWNTTSYNGDTYSKFKLSLTTFETVEQYTNIIARVCCEDVKVDDNSFFFIDPEFVIS